MTGLVLIGLGAAIILGWQLCLMALAIRAHRRPPPASAHPAYDWAGDQLLPDEEEAGW